jgi:hypothetical protein
MLGRSIVIDVDWLFFDRIIGWWCFMDGGVLWLVVFYGWWVDALLRLTHPT